jgi:hypothetical protein
MDDPNVGPGTPFVAHHHEQHHPMPKSEPFVHQRTASDTRPKSHLPPRSFEAPNRWYVVWFCRRKTDAPGKEKRVGAHIDLRFFVPILAVVCLVVALPLIISYPVFYTFSEAWTDAYFEAYDCAYVSI